MAQNTTDGVVHGQRVFPFSARFRHGPSVQRNLVSLQASKRLRALLSGCFIQKSFEVLRTLAPYNHGTVTKRQYRCIGLVCVDGRLVGIFVLKNSSVFAITNITAIPPDHIGQRRHSRAGGVTRRHDASNMDEKKITKSLKGTRCLGFSFERQFQYLHYHCENISVAPRPVRRFSAGI